MLSARRCYFEARNVFVQQAAYHAATTNHTAGLNAIVNANGSPRETPGDGKAEAEGKGSLAGKTIAIKDNIATTSLPTTAASLALSNYTSPFDATVITLLRQHGALIHAKTNLDEFGMGSHTQHSHHSPTFSPYTRTGIPLSAGGSSGGSAVAVATGECWAALGTDTGGSVRLPAAYMGVVGFKPSYGLLSRWGVVQYANSLDTVGVLGRGVEDARQVFGVLNRWDGRDPTSLPPALRERMADTTREKGRGKRERLRIGIPLDYNIKELSPTCRSAYTSTLTRLQRAGHTLHPVSLPTTRQALSAYYVLAPAEASSNLAKYDGIRYGYRSSPPDSSPMEGLPLYAKTRGEAFGPEVQRRILLGAYTLSSEAMDNYFIQAQKIRRLVQRDFDSAFALPNPLLDAPPSPSEQREKVDVLLTPTAPTLPPTVEEVKKQSAVEGYMNDVFTVPASLAGLPAVSVPVKLPREVRAGLGEGDVGFAGVQVVGQFGDDEPVLQVGEMIEAIEAESN